MAALLSCATEIRNGIQTHIKKTENIEKIIERKHGRTEMQETSIPSLKYDLRRSKRKADEMITEVKRMKTEETDRITRLEQHVEQTKEGFKTEMAVMRNQLTDTQNELMEMKTALHTGQTAYNFEKDLATYIYPPGTSITFGRIFSTMMKWLQDNKDTPEGREGNKKWNALKRKFKWSNKHEQVFFKMLKCRRKPAHPKVDYKLPIPDNFSKDEERYVEDIRKMTIRVNELVGLPNPNLNS
ncbi:Hypothetical predicted protein [Paramuricea clavata]|uniref:Uncharacterized protein n=1 Tax=Paramuricea clavata TaxID=317549 RepID=A0A6S7IZJ6_PARCT|nr:Hypothetical predicted protein [Paramuricea clavata]